MDGAESRSRQKKKSKTSKPDKPVRGKAAKAQGHVGPDPNERNRMIALGAYYRAEQRGFVNGDPVRDWLEAEAEVTMRLRDIENGKPVS